MLGLALLALLVDNTRPPSDQWSNRALIGMIGVYQASLSPQMPRLGVQCRFEPTCSHYGVGALRRHGSLKGSWLTLHRIARCGPWTPAGTTDPVPD